MVNEGDGVTFNAATGNNINSSQFGQITSTYDPRIIQLALRLSSKPVLIRRVHRH